MRKSLIIPAFALGMATVAGSALASDDDLRVAVPRDQWMTTTQITEKLTSQGYDVRQVKEDDGAYEVYAVKDGNRIEALVNPATGEMIRSEKDD